ncbi:kinase-regulated stress-responsive transcription factor skn7 [Mortierella sp. GBA43]|nr:kinase-regulated stress-responsive transcription factor skn7 [Mortierella sp. GBA43]
MAGQSLLESVISSSDVDVAMSTSDGLQGVHVDGTTSTATPGSSIPDFVKKLYRMLEEKEHGLIVSWGRNGETFVLNKYDFHKIKTNEESLRPYGDQAWEFQHPKFQYEKRALLEEIRRKTPNRRPNPGMSVSSPDQLTLAEDYQAHFDHMSKTQQDMQDQLTMYRARLEAQENLLRDLLGVLGYRSTESGTIAAIQTLSGHQMKDSRGPKVRTQPTSRPRVSLLGKVDGQSTQQHTMHSAFSSSSSSTMHPVHSATSPVTPLPTSMATLSTATIHPTASIPTPSSGAQFVPRVSTSGPYQFPQVCMDPSLDNPVLALGHLTPRRQEDWTKTNKPATKSTLRQPVQPQQPQQTQYTTGSLQDDIPEQQPQFSSPTVLSGHSSRVPRPSGGIPNWSMPPKVLLVEDDDTCRRYSARFLQIFGCSFDVAEDGVAAVGKMRMSNQKYDIVLMDIMMPKMDGVSATTQIRQFDAMTPIISMTSNTNANDCMTYYANGMNDILPKPFTRAGLLSMLEKHCQHLRYLKLGPTILGIASGSESNRHGNLSDTENLGFSLQGLTGQSNNPESSQRDSMESLGMNLQLGLEGMLILNSVDSSLHADDNQSHQIYQRQMNHGGLKQDVGANESDHNPQANYDMSSLGYGDMMDPMGQDDSSTSSLSPDQTHITIAQQQLLHQHVHGHQSQMTNSHHNGTSNIASSLPTTQASRYATDMASHSIMPHYSTGLDSPYTQHQNQNHGGIAVLSIRSDDGIARTLGFMNRSMNYNEELDLRHGMDPDVIIDRRKRARIEEVME